MTWYLGRVRWCLANRWKTMGVATVFIGGMLALFPLLPTGFSPAGDNGFTQLTVELAPGSTLEDTLAVAETVRKRLATLPEVKQRATRRSARRAAAAASAAAAPPVPCAARRSRFRSTTDAARAARSRRSSGRRPSACATSRARESNSTAATPTGMGDHARGRRLGPRSRARRRTSSARCASARSRHVTTSASLLQPEIVIRPDSPIARPSSA